MALKLKEDVKLLEACFRMKKPFVAFMLSFFLIGFGQFYNDQWIKGILLQVFGCFFLATAIGSSLTGFQSSGSDFIIETNVTITAVVLFCVLWLIGVVDAYLTAKKINARIIRELQQEVEDLNSD